MANYPIGITRSMGATWKMQDNYVERIMDNAAYTAAHPDDTLVMAGPPRVPLPKTGSANTGGTSKSLQDQLLAIGHLQTVQFQQQKPTQPVMAIGSGRSFFVSGKAQGQATLGRLFVNGRNLLRVLHHNARQNSLNVQDMDDRAANRYQSQFYINLDSELYLIPFGLGCIFRDKIHDLLGGFYVELTMITSYAIAFSAGQNMILEQSNLVFDRMKPFFETDVMKYNVEKTTLDNVMGFVDDRKSGTGASTDAENEETTKGYASTP
jgi:hypothetical protein